MPARAGVIKARLDLPADAFPFDDSLLFVLNVERRVGVLVVTAPGVEGLADPAFPMSRILRGVAITASPAWAGAVRVADEQRDVIEAIAHAWPAKNTPVMPS